MCSYKSIFSIIFTCALLAGCQSPQYQAYAQEQAKFDAELDAHMVAVEAESGAQGACIRKGSDISFEATLSGETTENAVYEGNVARANCLYNAKIAALKEKVHDKTNLNKQLELAKCHRNKDIKLAECSRETGDHSLCFKKSTVYMAICQKN